MSVAAEHGMWACMQWRQVLTAAALSAVASLGVTGSSSAEPLAPNAPGGIETSAAYPTSAFGVQTARGGEAYAGGTFTWYNRSINVQGYVDYQGASTIGYATVRFRFYSQNNVLLQTQTRTANQWERVPYNFTVPADVVGGVNRVEVRICETSVDIFPCSEDEPYYRP